MLDPISSNQAIGTATRPWIITPTAWLNRIWAPTLDYSSTWGNWNFNLGPNDWDFLSICLLLTPYQDWSAFPTPIVYDLRNSTKVYSTQLMEPCHWSPLWWGQPPDQPGCTPHTIYPRWWFHYGEDGPPTNQVAHRTPFIPFYPMVSHIGPREYASPTPIRHHSPFPLFHWPALNLPNTNGYQVALCLLASYTTWTLPCHINKR